MTHAAVFMLRPADHDVMSAAGFAVHAKGSPTTAVCGESGTGRTTRARMLAGDAIYVDVAAGLLDGRAPNVPCAATACAHRRTTARHRWNRLPRRRSLALLRTAVTTAAPEQPPLVLVSGPPGELTAAAAAVVACCGVRVDLAPLRRRETELAATVQQLLAGIDDRLTLNADAADCLVTQEWPGNLTELRIVLQQAAAATLRRGDRQVSGADLPDSHRTPTRVGRLLGRERAERQAIISALDAADRNKSRAAKALGISRTTFTRECGHSTYEADCTVQILHMPVPGIHARNDIRQRGGYHRSLPVLRSTDDQYRPCPTSRRCRICRRRSQDADRRALGRRGIREDLRDPRSGDRNLITRVAMGEAADIDAAVTAARAALEGHGPG